MSWIADLIGRPWQAGAAGPEAFDCRGLVAHALRAVYRLPVPTLLEADAPREFAAARASAEYAGWRPLSGDRPREADVLLVYGSGGAHVGIFVKYGTTLGVLHSLQPPGRGVRFDRFDELLTGSGFGRPSIWRHRGE